MIAIGVVLGLLSAPLLILVGSAIRALFLAWPAMIVMGALHTYIPAVPSLGFTAVFLLIMLLGLLIPTSTSSSSGSK